MRNPAPSDEECNEEDIREGIKEVSLERQDAIEDDHCWMDVSHARYPSDEYLEQSNTIVRDASEESAVESALYWQEASRSHASHGVDRIVLAPSEIDDEEDVYWRWLTTRAEDKKGTSPSKGSLPAAE